MLQVCVHRLCRHTLLHGLLVLFEVFEQPLLVGEVAEFNELPCVDGLCAVQQVKQFTLYLAGVGAVIAVEHGDVKVDTSGKAAVIDHRTLAAADDEHPACGVVLLDDLQSLLCALEQEVVVTVQQVKNRHAGVLRLLGIQGCALSSEAWLTL